MQKTKLLIVGLILFVLMVPNAGAKLSIAGPAHQLPLKHAVCSDELDATIGAAYGGDPAAVLVASEDLVGCVTQAVPNNICIRAYNWIDDQINNPVDYAEYLSSMAIASRKVVLFAQFAPVGPRDIVHREILLLNDSCISEDEDVGRIGWQFNHADGIQSLEPKAITQWASQMPVSMS